MRGGRASVSLQRVTGPWAARGLMCAMAAAVTSGFSASPSYRIHTFAFVDRTRTIALPNGTREARPIRTVVRYPATPGRRPLIVFAHGFALVPSTYGSLLDAWARAGYVVAAPIFPLTNADAPSGPNESDLINQPRDVSFVISRLVALNAGSHGVLAGKIDSGRIAVAGQSDGGVTALAVAYDQRFRDPRIRAAIVMSGARLGGMGSFPRHGPPLLAMQGTADTINAPGTTEAYFSVAAAPSSWSGSLGPSTSLRTRPSNPNSGSSSGRRSPSSATTSSTVHSRRSSQQRGSRASHEPSRSPSDLTGFSQPGVSPSVTTCQPSGKAAGPRALSSSTTRAFPNAPAVRGNSIARRRRRRWPWVLAAVLILLSPMFYSYSATMLQPSSLPLGVRSVEWLRTHHMNWLVDEAESVYYGLKAPKKGGPQLVALPPVGLSPPASTV